MPRQDRNVPQPTPADYEAAARVAAAKQGRHARSTARWGLGALALHFILPHAALLNDAAIIMTAVRGGQTAVNTVDRVTYASEADQLRRQGSPQGMDAMPATASAQRSRR